MNITFDQLIELFKYDKPLYNQMYNYFYEIINENTIKAINNELDDTAEMCVALEDQNNALIKQVELLKNRTHNIKTLSEFMDQFDSFISRANIKGLRDELLKQTGIRYKSEKEFIKDLENLKPNYRVKHTDEGNYLTTDNQGIIYITQHLKHDGTNIFKIGKAKDWVVRSRKYSNDDFKEWLIKQDISTDEKKQLKDDIKKMSVEEKHKFYEENKCGVKLIEQMNVNDRTLVETHLIQALNKLSKLPNSGVIKKADIGAEYFDLDLNDLKNVYNDIIKKYNK